MNNWIPHWLHKLSAPPFFHQFAGRVRPWCLWLALLTTAIGLFGGLVLAPPDYQQGDSFRIMYIHVPSAWMSLFVYATMAVAAIIAVVWRIKVAESVAMQSAYIGAAFTLITLVTGSLWGAPTWGTWWTWDARLTSELVLLFLYLGVIGLYQAFEDRRQGARAAGFLAIVGLVNLPIVHYSVKWWNTLHQGTSVRLLGDSSIEPDMLWPLLVMALAMHLYWAGSLLGRVRADLLDLERGKRWVRELSQHNTGTGS